MQCGDLAADLSAYVDEELPSARMAAVESHLPSCDACSRVVAELRVLRAYLQNVPEVEILRPIEWWHETGPTAKIAWDCDAIGSQLSALLDGELSAWATEAVLGHLDLCTECLRKYSLLQATAGVLSVVPQVPAPADLRERIWARIRADQAASAELPARWRRWAPAAAVAAAAASLLFAVVMRSPQPGGPEVVLVPPPPPRAVVTPAPPLRIPAAPAVEPAVPTVTPLETVTGPTGSTVRYAPRGPRAPASPARPPAMPAEREPTAPVRPTAPVPAMPSRALPGAEPVATPGAGEAVIAALPAMPAPPRDVVPPAATAPPGPAATSLPPEAPKPKPAPADIVRPSAPAAQPAIIASADVGALRPAAEPSGDDTPRAPRANRPARNGVLFAAASPGEAKARLERNAEKVKEAFAGSTRTSGPGGLAY